MRRALLSLFIYSVIIVIATAGGGTSGVISAGTERSIDVILQDCCEVANYSDFADSEVPNGPLRAEGTPFGEAHLVAATDLRLPRRAFRALPWLFDILHIFELFSARPWCPAKVLTFKFTLQPAAAPAS